MRAKILTLHPAGKAGVNIERTKYDVTRAAILDALRVEGEIPFARLVVALKSRLRGFDGSIAWYGVTVKLDLEARGLVERVPGTRPEHLRLTARGGRGR